MNTLPTEILNIISSSVDISDILSMRSVCRSWLLASKSITLLNSYKIICGSKVLSLFSSDELTVNGYWTEYTSKISCYRELFIRRVAPSIQLAPVLNGILILSQRLIIENDEILTTDWQLGMQLSPEYFYLLGDDRLTLVRDKRHIEVWCNESLGKNHDIALQLPKSVERVNILFRSATKRWIKLVERIKEIGIFIDVDRDGSPGIRSSIFTARVREILIDLKKKFGLDMLLKRASILDAPSPSRPKTLDILMNIILYRLFNKTIFTNEEKFKEISSSVIVEDGSRMVKIF